jgi:hypothetical protein
MDEVKFYAFRVEYFWDHDVTSSRGFVAAEDYADAARQVIEAFEEDDNIISLSIADMDCGGVLSLDEASEKDFAWDKKSEIIGEEGHNGE